MMTCVLDDVAKLCQPGDCNEIILSQGLFLISDTKPGANIE